MPCEGVLPGRTPVPALPLPSTLVPPPPVPHDTLALPPETHQTEVKHRRWVTQVRFQRSGGLELALVLVLVQALVLGRRDNKKQNCEREGTVGTVCVSKQEGIC